MDLSHEDEIPVDLNDFENSSLEYCKSNLSRLEDSTVNIIQRVYTLFNIIILITGAGIAALSFIYSQAVIKLTPNKFFLVFGFVIIILSIILSVDRFVRSMRRHTKVDQISIYEFLKLTFSDKINSKFDYVTLLLTDIKRKEFSINRMKENFIFDTKIFGGIIGFNSIGWVITVLSVYV